MRCRTEVARVIQRAKGAARSRAAGFEYAVHRSPAAETNSGRAVCRDLASMPACCDGPGNLSCCSLRATAATAGGGGRKDAGYGAVSAFAHRRRLPDANDLHLHQAVRRAYAAGRWRYRLAHAHRRVDSGSPSGSSRRFVFVQPPRRAVVRLGMAVGRYFRRCFISAGGWPPWFWPALWSFALPTAVLFRLIRRKCDNGLVAIAVTLLATGGCAIHWLARPHLFTFLFFVLTLHITTGRRRKAAPNCWGGWCPSRWSGRKFTAGSSSFFWSWPAISAPTFSMQRSNATQSTPRLVPVAHKTVVATFARLLRRYLHQSLRLEAASAHRSIHQATPISWSTSRNFRRWISTRPSPSISSR